MIYGQWTSVTITTDSETVDLTPFVKQIEIDPAHDPGPWDCSRCVTHPGEHPPAPTG